MPSSQQRFARPAAQASSPANGPCRLPNGQQREVDAALAVGKTLLLAECRTFGRSFGVERGDPAAIDFRNAKIRKALADADDKATLLAAAPVGRNYDLRRFDRIVPIGVTPFAEFIPSIDQYYWLTENIPRVLTPPELENAIKTGVFDGTIPNAIAVKHC